MQAGAIRSRCFAYCSYHDILAMAVRLANSQVKLGMVLRRIL